MKILSAEFVQSCVKPEQYPRDRLPEVAFVGRSNVGKSSAINSLLNRKGIAKVSTTPGKTQTINFYRVMTDGTVLNKIYFVDLPGYGYAKASRSVREQWGPMIEDYLTGRSQLFAVVQLVDSRGIEDHDVTTLQWLAHIGHKPIVIGTKIDKLSRGQRRATVQKIRERLELPQMEDVIVYSSRTNEGRHELWRAMRRQCESFQTQNHPI